MFTKKSTTVFGSLAQNIPIQQNIPGITQLTGAVAEIQPGGGICPPPPSLKEGGHCPLLLKAKNVLIPATGIIV